jgi:membrane dipeptidase
VKKKIKPTNKLHTESIIIDGLNISVWDRETFSKLRIGGITAINATTACWENFRDSIQNIEKWNRRFETFSDYIMPIRNVKDIKKAKKIRKTGIIIGFQNTTPIEDDINLLRIFKDLGVRIIQLTFQDRNYVGDGCWEKTDAGLSEFGLRVIKEMNHQGILIDLSHAGDKTAVEAIEASEKPVAFTHANPRSLKDNPRNKTDEQILNLADKGGIIGATLYPPLLSAGYTSELNDFLDVIDYLVDLVGVDHTAIGSDFTENQPNEFFIEALTGKSWEKPLSNVKYPVIYPESIRSVTEFPNITDGLVKRGYAKKDVKKIMGENWLQLYSNVWKN